MTDATGRSFLSYRRTRVADARLLVEAQHDVGIPTWQDINELDHGHTEQLLRQTLLDEATANAVCLITPDVESSDVITRTELPSIMRRVDRRDGFFMMPIAAGGLDYADVTRIVGTYLGLHDLGDWNIYKATSDPISENEATRIARVILKHRLTEIVRQGESTEPLRMALNTRKRPPLVSGVALSLDWTHRFDGRTARSPDTWSEHLLPALETVAEALEVHAAGRTIVAGGLCAIPAAIALGSRFLATRRLPIAWEQISPNRPPQHWSLAATPEPSGFEYRLQPGDPGGNDLALLVSVASAVDPAFGASRPSLPRLRGLVVVTKPGEYPHDIPTAGQAVDAVHIILEGLRKARTEFQPRGIVHLFLAVPAGLAMMIGQVLNTLGSVQTYEHIGTDTVGAYQPAALLYPSA
jgi:hypothetical protein